ncbi:MAG: SrfB, partial [uncultured Acetobacteraceae bacterium]
AGPTQDRQLGAAERPAVHRPALRAGAAAARAAELLGTAAAGGAGGRRPGARQPAHAVDRRHGHPARPGQRPHPAGRGGVLGRPGASAGALPRALGAFAVLPCGRHGGRREGNLRQGPDQLGAPADRGAARARRRRQHPPRGAGLRHRAPPARRGAALHHHLPRGQRARGRVRLRRGTRSHRLVHERTLDGAVAPGVAARSPPGQRPPRAGRGRGPRLRALGVLHQPARSAGRSRAHAPHQAGGRRFGQPLLRADQRRSRPRHRQRPHLRHPRRGRPRLPAQPQQQLPAAPARPRRAGAHLRAPLREPGGIRARELRQGRHRPPSGPQQRLPLGEPRPGGAGSGAPFGRRPGQRRGDGPVLAQALPLGRTAHRAGLALQRRRRGRRDHRAPGHGRLHGLGDGGGRGVARAPPAAAARGAAARRAGAFQPVLADDLPAGRNPVAGAVPDQRGGNALRPQLPGCAAPAAADPADDAPRDGLGGAAHLPRPGGGGRPPRVGHAGLGRAGAEHAARAAGHGQPRRGDRDPARLPLHGSEPEAAGRPGQLLRPDGQAPRGLRFRPVPARRQHRHRRRHDRPDGVHLRRRARPGDRAEAELPRRFPHRRRRGAAGGDPDGGPAAARRRARGRRRAGRQGAAPGSARRRPRQPERAGTAPPPATRRAGAGADGPRGAARLRARGGPGAGRHPAGAARRAAQEPGCLRAGAIPGAAGRAGGRARLQAARCGSGHHRGASGRGGPSGARPHHRRSLRGDLRLRLRLAPVVGPAVAHARGGGHGAGQDAGPPAPDRRHAPLRRRKLVSVPGRDGAGGRPEDHRGRRRHALRDGRRPARRLSDADQPLVHALHRALPRAHGAVGPDTAEQRAAAGPGPGSARRRCHGGAAARGEVQHGVPRAGLSRLPPARPRALDGEPPLHAGIREPGQRAAAQASAPAFHPPDRHRPRARRRRGTARGLHGGRDHGRRRRSAAQERGEASVADREERSRLLARHRRAGRSL